MTKKLAVFLLIQLFVTFIAWCGGYDFDTRNVGVGYLVFVSIYLGLILSAVIDIGNDKK